MFVAWSKKEVSGRIDQLQSSRFECPRFTELGRTRRGVTGIYKDSTPSPRLPDRKPFGTQHSALSTYHSPTDRVAVRL